jgi:hypothetical protein
MLQKTQQPFFDPPFDDSGDNALAAEKPNSIPLAGRLAGVSGKALGT